MAESDWTNWIQKKVTKEVVFAFLLGVVVGLVVLGWWLWPVRWINADPVDLREVHKQEYLQMIADSYALTGDVDVAHARLGLLKAPGEDDTDLAAMLDAAMQERIEAGKADQAFRLQGLASAVILPPPPTAEPTAAEPAGVTGGGTLRALGIFFFLLLLGSGIVLLLSRLQRQEAVRRRRPSAAGPPVTGAGEELAAMPAEGSLGQFETTFNLGDEGYDVSTSIQSSAGDFIGECGVSAVDDLAVGEVGSVSAFEIWLFDKDDVRTETTVLLSEAAAADGTVRERLAPKGKLLEAEQGQVITLETANLRLQATIAEVEYETDAHAAFAKLTTRLEVFGS
jgi:hypothetical protein